METQKKPGTSWLDRVEDLINVLEGSSVGELELTEDGTEIIIRRRPDLVLTTATITDGVSGAPIGKRGEKADTSVPIVAPLTGVYYSAASPSTPPFANVGDIVNVGQVVALVEAMKVFNEITAEVSGRVTAHVATNGNVVQKGDALLRVEPL
jgi:acetyl-CoA carboxylase biotin carboxyl carrier protein